MSALEGIRILDMSRMPHLAYCVMNLEELDAEVIKLEAPVDPDALLPEKATLTTRSRKMRKSGPLIIPLTGIGSLPLNLKSEEARRVFYRLV